MKITILVDDGESWFISYADDLKKELQLLGHDCILVNKHDDVRNGDICYMLSCVRIAKEELLKLNKHNIVVHASDLPFGKGFSPMKWQILEGKKKIVLTLFEAVAEVDSGGYYFKDYISYEGYELLDDLLDVMAKKINEMCINYANNIDNYTLIKLEGEGSWYPRFRDVDDKLDEKKSICEQFNHFRIADNDRHPLWFEIDGHKYYLKIYKE